MSLVVVCPGCQGQFQAPPTMAGKSARCPSCSQKITIPAAPVASSAPSSTPAEKSKADSAARPAVKRNEPRAKPNDAKQAVKVQAVTTEKAPLISGGMRWFLIIVVVPIAVIYLVGQLAR